MLVFTGKIGVSLRNENNSIIYHSKKKNNRVGIKSQTNTFRKLCNTLISR